MKKDYYKDRTVCSLQLELKYKYKLLATKCKEWYNNEEIDNLICEMKQISQSIHYKATRMEKRLQKYRKSIEGLGFKRERK